MRREGGLGGPLLYGLIGVTLGAMFGIVAQGAFSGFGVPGFPSEAREAVGSAVGIVALMIIAPVFALVGLFIGSAICHVLLLLIGGARFPYETTFRVICYSSGSTSLVNIVPVCGGLIAAVWSIVVSIIGVAQAHEISTGKATLAVLGPMVVCCTAFILLLSLMFVVGFAAVSGEFMELMRKLLAALETRRV